MTSYGAHFDLDGKRPRLSQWFPPADVSAPTTTQPESTSSGPKLEPSDVKAEAPPPPSPPPSLAELVSAKAKQKAADPSGTPPKQKPADPSGTSPKPKPSDDTSETPPKSKPADTSGTPPKPKPADTSGTPPQPKPADTSGAKASTPEKATLKPSPGSDADKLQLDFANGRVLKEVEEPPCCFKLVPVPGQQIPKIMVQSLSATNRKFAKLQLLYFAGQGKLVKSIKGQPDDSLPYSELLTAASYVLDSDKGKSVCLLKDLVSSTGATEVHGFKPFPAGALPTKLVANEGAALYLKDTDELMLQINSALVLINHCSVVWSFSLQGKKLIPGGAGLLSIKQLTLPGGKISVLPL